MQDIIELTADDKAYLTGIGLNPDNYVKVALDYTLFAYYNCSSNMNSAPNGKVDNNLVNFISTRPIAKDEIPNGSIIRVDKGYQYRPEGWPDLNTSIASGTRPANVVGDKDINYVVVNDAWWGSWTICGFNLSAASARTMKAEEIAHLRIYIPNSANATAPTKTPDMLDINNIVPEETTAPAPSEPVVYDDTAAFTALGLNIADYVELDWVLEVQAYYNSKNGIAITNHSNSTASNIPNFIASKLLTKEDLPVGSVIIVDSGYQYRPEGWLDANTKTSSRPGNTSVAVVKVDDAWWSNWTIRAFNLSAVTTRAMTDADIVHLRIYVPKK